MTLNELNEWIANPAQLNVETLLQLRECVRRYPYFQTARLLYIHNLMLLENPLLESAVEEAALFLSDRKVLFRLLEGDRFQIKPLTRVEELPVVPAESQQPLLKEEDDRTSSLIDSFLTVYKEEKQRGAAVPVDLSLDYASVLKEEPVSAVEAATEMKGQHLIDSFIAGDEFQLKLSTSDSAPLEEETSVEWDYFSEETPVAEVAESAPSIVPIEDEESCFTETLAKIYVKQGRYAKAIEIIKKLNLKYPEKNSYFADQIRFLEKLIINTKSE